MVKTKGRWGSKVGNKENHFYVLDGNETAPICRRIGSSVLDIRFNRHVDKCKECATVIENE